MFYPDYFRFWTEGVSSVFLCGITGKTGVAAFGTITAFFAYRHREENPLRYFFRRYAYFWIAGFSINVLYIVTGKYVMKNVLELLTVSFSLGDQIFSAFWCMKAFFVSSCIAFLNGKYHASVALSVIEIIIFVIIGWDWVAISLVGSLVALLLEKEKINNLFSRKSVLVVTGVIGILLIKLPENRIAYLLAGLSAGLLIMIMESSKLLQKVLSSFRLFPWLGKYTMTLYLLHLFVFSLLEPFLISVFVPGIPHGIVFLCLFLFTFIIMLPFAILLQKLFDLYNKGIRILSDHIAGKDSSAQD